MNTKKLLTSCFNIDFNKVELIGWYPNSISDSNTRILILLLSSDIYNITELTTYYMLFENKNFKLLESYVHNPIMLFKFEFTNENPYKNKTEEFIPAEFILDKNLMKK